MPSFISIGSAVSAPQGVENHHFPYGRLGEWLLQQCYALTCYTVKGLGDIGFFSITGTDVMPISSLGAPNFKSDLIFGKHTSDFLLVVKRNEIYL